MSERKPCPFCESAGGCLVPAVTAPEEDPSEYYVYCNMCECCGPVMLTEASAEFAWNSRPEQPGQATHRMEDS